MSSISDGSCTKNNQPFPNVKKSFIIQSRRGNTTVRETYCMEDLYTSSKAREILNVSTSTFKILVDGGKIRKRTPPGKKQGYYVKEDVDKVAKERAAFAKIEQSTKRGKTRTGILKTDVDWLKPSDLPAVL